MKSYLFACAGALLVAAWSMSAWCQEPAAPGKKLPPAADAPKAGAAKDATKPARDAVPGTREKAKEEIEEAREGAKEAREGAKDARRGAREAGKEARETGREARETVRDTRRETRETRRDARSVSAETTRAADLGLWFSSRAGADGLVIADVAAEGAIAKIGFREGDRIVSVNGTAVRTEADFMRLILADDIRSERVEVVVFRDGREQVLYVQPALLIDEVVAYDPLWRYGIVLDDRYPDRIVVLRVYPRTPAYYWGLRAGDVITTFGGTRIATSQDFIRAFSSADGDVALQVTRGNRTRDLQIDTSAAVEGESRATLRPRIEAEGRAEGGAEGRIEGRTKGTTRPADPKARRPADDRPRLDTPPTDRPGAEKPRAEKPAAEKPAAEKPAEPPKVELPDVPETPAPKTPKTPKLPGGIKP